MDSSVLDGNFFNINTLTVVASESYDSFAKELQKEIVESLSDRPTKLTTDVLVDRVLRNEKGEKFVFDSQAAMDLIFDFKFKGYVDEKYMLTDKLIDDIKNDKIELPDKFKDFKEGVCDLMQSIYTTANFKATSNEKENHINEAFLKPNDNFAKKEFQDLWNKIKAITVYEVDFDSVELIEKSIRAIDRDLTVRKVRVSITEGEQKEKMDEASLKAGKSMTKQKSITEKAEWILGGTKYDLIDELTGSTKLTRKTIVRILQGLRTDTFYNFRINPESFIKEVSRIINNEKAATLINNIIYSKTDKTYSDDIFTINNFQGSLSENILEVQKHIYDYLKSDSKIERQFATDLEGGEVLVYAKLPNDFKIPTPVGNYNPDWAIVFDNADFKYIYFIAETKGSMESLQLREIEERKINYAKKHFESLGHADIKYDVIKTYQDLRDKVLQ